MITRECPAAPQASRLSPRIRAEYLDLPGLNLTLLQASRLWGAEPWLCRDALEILVAAGFLVKVEDRYLRADRRWCDRSRRN